jgi:DNA-binding transcriptional LysR family regulator
MDMRSLTCFVVLAEVLNFRRAAERVHLTQPSLSQRIRVLEEEVGVPLFARDKRSVALTDAGRAFLPGAREAVQSAQRAKQLALQAARGTSGLFRLGFTVIAFQGALPEAIQRFRQYHPEVAVELTELNSPLLELALARGELDMAVLHPPLENPALKLHALPEERLVLALPEGHPLAHEPVIPLQALGNEPFLLAPRAIGAAIHDRVLALFQGEAVPLRIAQEVAPMTSLLALGAAGAGIGFITASMAHQGRAGIVFRPVVPTPPSLPMAAAWATETLVKTGERFLGIADPILHGAALPTA